MTSTSYQIRLLADQIWHCKDNIQLCQPYVIRRIAGKKALFYKEVLN
jgi:hypothetical protein